MDDVWVSQVDAEHGLQRLQGGVALIPLGMQCLHHLPTYTCYSLPNTDTDKCNSEAARRTKEQTQQELNKAVQQ